MNLNYLFHAMNFTSNYSCNFLLGVFLGVVIINDLLFSVLLSSLLEDACFKNNSVTCNINENCVIGYEQRLIIYVLI